MRPASPRSPGRAPAPRLAPIGVRARVRLAATLPGSCLALLLALTPCPGCGDGGDGGGVEETGYLTASLITTTAREEPGSAVDVEIEIVGAPGAAPGAGTVTATNLRSGALDESAVSDVGSFVLRVPGLRDDVVRVGHRDVGRRDEVELAVPDLDDFPERRPGGVRVLPPDDRGLARVRVETAIAVGDGRLAVSNRRNQRVVLLERLAPTTWAGSIPARSGDILLLHRTTEGRPSQALVLTVP